MHWKIWIALQPSSKCDWIKFILAGFYIALTTNHNRQRKLWLPCQCVGSGWVNLFIFSHWSWKDSAGFVHQEGKDLSQADLICSQWTSKPLFTWCIHRLSITTLFERWWFFSRFFPWKRCKLKPEVLKISIYYIFKSATKLREEMKTLQFLIIFKA